MVGALTNETGISGEDIGRISLSASKCFVGLPGEIADLVLSVTGRLAIRGKKVAMSRKVDGLDRLRDQLVNKNGKRPSRRSPGGKERSGRRHRGAAGKGGRKKGRR